MFCIICIHYNICFVLSKLVYKASLQNNVLLVYNPKPKCMCTHSAIYVFCLICLNHNNYFVLSKFVYKAVPQKCMFVLLYNLKSNSFCIQSFLYVLCLICLNQNILFFLLKFENNSACINNIYFQVYKY